MAGLTDTLNAARIKITQKARLGANDLFPFLFGRLHARPFPQKSIDRFFTPFSYP
jgi:hypothetical protein